MFCSNCGNQIPEGAETCPSCNQPVAQSTENTQGTQATENTQQGQPLYQNPAPSTDRPDGRYKFFWKTGPKKFRIMNIVALAFEPWYEGWGTEDAWEAGDYFDGILEAANVDVIVGTIKIVLWIVTIICAIACILIYLLSKKVEPSKAEIDAAFKKSCDAISARHNKELEEMIAEEEIAVAADAVERAAEAAKDNDPKA